MEKYLSRVKPENKESTSKAYKIYSKILGDCFWLVATEKEGQVLVAEGIKEVIYTHEEVSSLIDEDVSNEGLAATHKVKKVFSGTAESIESTKSNTAN